MSRESTKKGEGYWKFRPSDRAELRLATREFRRLTGRRWPGSRATKWRIRQKALDAFWRFYRTQSAIYCQSIRDAEFSKGKKP